MLFQYMQDCQRLLREQRQELINPDDLIPYINTARRDIAGFSQSIRVLTPSAGSVKSIAVTAGGSGYSATPTVTVSAPDFPNGRKPYPTGAQATAAAVVVGGVITQINVTYGGDGYFQPIVTITDTTGSGATATAATTYINELVQGQEVYPFSAVDLSANPGVDSVFAVRSVSIIYNNYRYSLPMYAFSTYQAMIRQYPFQYQWVPTFSSQYGQGTNGDLYLYPLPSQVYQVEYDCQCLPSDLTDDQSVEALPMPWRDAVKFYACHLAFLELQNFNAAQGYLALYEKFAQRYSNFARIGRAVNPYGRY